MAKYVNEANLQRFWDNIQDQIGNASQEQVDAWLDEHPEATTTVQDGSITTPKLASDVKELITGFDDYEVLHGKYASYSGNTVNLYNINNCGCIKISVSEHVGEHVQVSSELLNATYNILYVFADSSSNRISYHKTTDISYRDKIVTIPTNAAYMYVNFDDTSSVIRARVLKLSFPVPMDAIIHCLVPIIVHDPIAKTLTISNRMSNTLLPVYVEYGWDYQTIANSSTELNQTFSNVNNGVLVYDITNKTFAFLTSYAMAERSRYAIIATFTSGVVTYATSRITTIANENKHAKKSMVCYGDSLTWYDGQEATWGPDQGTTIVGFESYLQAYLNLSVTNAGQSGQTLPQICARMASDSVPRDRDIVMLMGGNNDDRLNVSVGTLLPQGSTFDTTTTIGAMQNAIETVLTANPTATLILATEPMGWTWNGSSLERVDDVYPNAIRRVAELYGLPLLDLWKISGVNEMTRNTMYLDPPDTENQQYMYHPNNYGWKVISERIIQFIQTL